MARAPSMPRISETGITLAQLAALVEQLANESRDRDAAVLRELGDCRLELRETCAVHEVRLTRLERNGSMRVAARRHWLRWGVGIVGAIVVSAVGAVWALVLKGCVP